jgi:hypothetical protein
MLRKGRLRRKMYASPLGNVQPGVVLGRARERVEEPPEESGEDREVIADLLSLEAEALFMDGFDDAIIGSCHQFGRPVVVAYDLEKVLEILVKQGCTWEEAEEWWSYNQVGAWMGEWTPVFVRKLEK